MEGEDRGYSNRGHQGGRRGMISGWEGVEGGADIPGRAWVNHMSTPSGVLKMICICIHCTCMYCICIL